MGLVTGHPRVATIALLSTYPPTHCGLATFSAALWEQLNRSSGAATVVRVVDRPEPAPGPEVLAQLVNGSTASAAAAVATLNDHDVVVLQHEYGIYGGPDGCDVVEILEALTVPSIVVLHTVLQEPTPRQRRILLRLLAGSDVAVTLTETARRRLVDTYGADPSAVMVIPHGATDHGARRLATRQHERPLVLTWGLLGPGKGIEWAIDAMAGLRDLMPRYLVVGRTHPKVAERHGEAYRTMLSQRVARHRLSDLVELDDSYLSVTALAQLVERADVVLLPYDSREQVTSGVLTEAVAAGRPVVSTAFPHAVELLSDGRGLIVQQGDSQAIEQAVRRVLREPQLAASMAAKSAAKAPELLWPAVADRYQLTADRLTAAALATAS